MSSPNRNATRRWSAGLAALVAVALTYAVVTSNEASAGPPAVANQYIGAKKCKNCHSSEATGDQYGKWMAAPHAKAYETLASPEAKKAAADVGIADPQKADECMRCHQTAFGVAEAEIKKGFDPHMGVQCETCHGPGKDHMMARMKAAATQGDGPVVLEEGEVVTTVSADTCKQCHNEDSPSYKPFCYHEYAKKIRHLNPKKPRTPEELAKLDECMCDESCVCREESPDKSCRSAKK